MKAAKGELFEDAGIHSWPHRQHPWRLPAAVLSQRTRPHQRSHQRKQIILCTCVASDILPPISKLTPDQVTYHIISGYTAKVAGTEEGVKVTVLTDTLSANPFVNAVPGHVRTAMEWLKVLTGRSNDLVDQRRHELWRSSRGGAD